MLTLKAVIKQFAPIAALLGLFAVAPT